jgi:hypothetical protein
MISPGYTKPETNWDEFEKYTARSMTKRLVVIFDNVTGNRSSS